MARLLVVMTSVLVITTTTISSTFGVNPAMGGGSLHGSKNHRDGAWGIRVKSGITMSPSHQCIPVKVCRVLNKHFCIDRRC